MICLIAVNPNGAACFISDLFEGSIDDYSILNHSDSFLVDKGYNIEYILLSKQSTILIPKARIHIQRFN